MSFRSAAEKARGARLGPQTRDALRAALVLALCALWLDQAFRLVPGPLVTLPLDILGRPRRDLGWLCALASMAAASLVLALRGGRGAVRPAASVGRADPAALAAAAVCSLATGLSWLGSSSVPAVAAAGLLGGAGFSVLALRLVAMAPLGSSPSEALLAGCAALGASAALRACLPLLGFTALACAMCLLPLLAAGLACRFWGGQGRASAASGASSPGAAPAADSQGPGPRPVQVRHHLTVLVSCFLGLGLYMGVIGFSNDSLAQTAFVSRFYLNGAAGAALACLLVAASMRPNPDGPYAMLPVMLGTSALVFLLTTIMAPSPASESLAHVAGRATDSMAVVLAACTMLELGYQRGQAPLRQPSAVMAACSASLFVGIMLGGVLMSVVGFGTTSIVLTAASLLYGAVLSLGLSVRQRDREQFVVVRSAADMERIAQLQARALADELGNLTPREEEVLPYLLQHASLDEVAERLGISRNTVKTHVAHIYEKANVGTRAQLVDLAAGMTVNL